MKLEAIGNHLSFAIKSAIFVNFISSSNNIESNRPIFDIK